MYVSWKISAPDSTIIQFFFRLLHLLLICRVIPDVELLVPANTHEARVFDFRMLKVIPAKVYCRVIDADHRSDLSINSWFQIRAY